MQARYYEVLLLDKTNALLCALPQKMLLKELENFPSRDESLTSRTIFPANGYKKKIYEFCKDVPNILPESYRKQFFPQSAKSKRASETLDFTIEQEIEIFFLDKNPVP